MKPIIQKIWMVMAMLCMSIPMSAYDFEVDGIQYDITSFTDLTVMATSLSDYSVADLIVPDSVVFNGKKLAVTQLGDSFAADNKSLVSVQVGSNVGSISTNAFRNCVALEKVELSGADQIDTAAFSGCSNLTDVIFSNKLNQIGAQAFYGCNLLETLQIPNSVTSIGEAAFQDCNRLNHISISNITVISSSTFSGCSSLDDITFSDSLSSIGNNAFNGCAFESFEIPNSVQTLGGYILSNCQNLKSLIIGNGIEILSQPIFTGCPLLDTISFSDGNNALRFSYTTGNAKYTSPHNPDSYSVNAYGCFEGTNVKFVYIGRDLKCGTPGYKIYSVPFLGNETIETITIGPKVTNIPLAGMYSDGREISESTWASYNVGFFQGCINVKKVEIQGGGLQKLSNQIFKGCSGLEQISFGYNISSMGDDALADCNSLSNLYFYSEKAPSYSGEFNNELYINCHIFVPTGAKESFQSTEPWANFWNLDEDSALIAAFTVNGIKYEVLRANEVEIVGTDLNEISDIELSDYVIYKGYEFITTAISDHAFNDNQFIQSINIPNNITIIKDSQFKGCTNLKKISLPEGIILIGISAFQGCNKLTDIQIPNSVNAIGVNCFSGCAFSCMDLSSSLIDEIPSNAFENCSQLSSVKFPLQEFTIGNRAFMNCQLLSDIDLKNVILIGDEAFRDCNFIETIVIPKSCKQIGNGAFNNVIKLKYITFEAGASSLLIGHSNSLSLSSSITPFPNPSDVDERRTGFKNGYYDGLFYGLPIEHLVINRDIELPKYYERTTGNSTSSYSTVYNDIVYYPPFYGLTNLKYIEIGENVSAICKNQIEAVVNAVPTTMEYTNFGKCDNIEVVISNNPNAPIGGGFSQTVYEQASLFLPNGGIDSYKNDDYWKNFAHINETSFIPVESISFESDEVTIDVNESKKLNTIINPSEASIKTLKWSSSNTSIVNVSEDGGIASSSREGEAIITATACDGSNVSASIRIMVQEGAGISDVVADSKFDISIKDGCILISGKAETDIVEIYNIQGQLIKSSTSNIIIINSNGVYLVKIGSICKKIVL